MGDGQMFLSYCAEKNLNMVKKKKKLLACKTNVNCTNGEDFFSVVCCCLPTKQQQKMLQLLSKLKNNLC